MRKNLLLTGLALLFLLLFYVFLAAWFPKSAGRFPAFALLFILDIYLWTSLWGKVKSFKASIKWLLGGMYWLPFGLILLFTAAIGMLPYDQWNPAVRTYLGGVIVLGYGSKLLPMVFLLLADAVRLIQYLFRRGFQPEKIQTDSNGKKMSRSRFLKYVGLLGGGVVFSGLLMGMVKWVYDFRIRRERIKLPHLPAAFDGFRIVQISDIHMGSWVSDEPLAEAVKMINDLRADVVFFTGDLVNYTTSEAYPFEEILNQIKAKYGVFSTLGNHDYGDYVAWSNPVEKQYNLQRMHEFHHKLGWKLLNNANHIIQKDGEELAVVGVENWGSFSRFPKHGRLDVALQGTESVAVKLLLTHDPSHWEHIVLKRFPEVDVSFAGHTHGMQLGVEIPGVRWSPSQYMYKRWGGLYAERPHQKSQYLYVNRGLGSLGYPGRIGILPEITLVELHA